MNNRFIECYSQHRNRKQFPYPSQYIVPFSVQPMIARDPILDGGIYFTWVSKPLVQTSILKSGTTNASPKLNISNSLKQPSEKNYYNGYLMIVNGNGEIQSRYITSYDPIDVGVDLNTSFSFNNYQLKQGDSYSIFDVNTPDMIHLPIKDELSNDVYEYSQAYNGYYIVDETLSYGSKIVARMIDYYDFEMRYCYLDKPFPNEWGIEDSYTLRKTLPSEKWLLDKPTTRDGSYFLITLPSGAKAINNFYKGQYIYFSSNLSKNDEIIQYHYIYGTYFIVEYDGEKRCAKCLLNSITNEVIETSYPTSGDMINIVNFARDNYCPLLYNGSMVSQNQTVCYEVMLLNLILPNVTLMSGSRIAFYPYVYVELKNITSPSMMSTQLIYSNNPESERALFIVGINDVVQPIVGRFVKLIGRMRQTVKFKPNDALRFSVYLPDGTLFMPLRSDAFTPYEPDRTLQIEAIFSIRRL